MALHDVSGELRGFHGRWTKAGAAMHRMEKEAAGAGAGPSHADVAAKVGQVQRGTGRTIGGHRIDRTQKDMYRVGLRKPGGGRDTKLYSSPEHAAQAIAEGKHHEAGGAAKVAGGARTRGSEPRGPEISKGPTSGEGFRYTVKTSGTVRTDGTHYGVYDKRTGTFVTTGVKQHDALQETLQRNMGEVHPETARRGASPLDRTRPLSSAEVRRRERILSGAPASKEVRTAATSVPTRGRPNIKSLTTEEMGKQLQAGNLTPKDIADELERRGKIEAEAANRARLPGGGLTINKGARGGNEPAEYLRKLRGGAAPSASGTGARTFETVNNEYLAAHSKLQNTRITGPAAIAANKRDLQRLEEELRGMGARRSLTGVGFEMPKPQTVDDQIAGMEQSLREMHAETGAPLYRPLELVSTRLDSVKKDLASGDKRITIKVPSGSEVTVPREVAAELVRRVQQQQSSYIRQSGVGRRINRR